jgi:hypothetical protein
VPPLIDRRYSVRVSAGKTGSDNEGRGLVEHAIRHLLLSAPPNWVQVHVECQSTGSTVAYVAVADSGSSWLNVPPEVSATLTGYLRAQAVGRPPSQTLIIDCFPDGRLAARFEPHPDTDPRIGRSSPRRWRTLVPTAIAAVCLVAAAAIFVTDWGWSDPPDADIALLSPPPPRQQEAFDVISQWFDALAEHDIARIQELSCANPTGYVLNDIQSMQGIYRAGIDYAVAIVEFEDEGERVLAKLVLQTKPLTEESAYKVAELVRTSSGLSYIPYVLVDQGGTLKVCGGE